MKMQLQHALAYLAALCGTLGMAWGAHADWFYDFQTAPPPSFLVGTVPGSATFSSSVGAGVLLLTDTRAPAFKRAVADLRDQAARSSQRFGSVEVDTNASNTAGVVQQLGGKISVENRVPEEGGGARFTVTLPIEGGSVVARKSITPRSTIT